MGRLTTIMTVSVSVTDVVPSASKLQPSTETLPDTLVLHAGQLIHDTEPSYSVYSPGLQLSQVAVPKAGAMVPGAHLVQPEDPSGANLPVIHSEHVATDVEPSVAENMPPEQATLLVGPPVQ